MSKSNDNIDDFLKSNPENGDYNQYWYSNYTIDKIVEDLNDCTGTIAFLSTPSLYFSLSIDKRNNSYLFDYDTKWNSDRGFIKYDFNQPDNIPKHLLGTFDCVVIDPPFITREVWEKYTNTAKLLMKNSSSKILLTTIYENADFLSTLLNVKPQIFMPSIPNLVYQYHLYTNYNSIIFQQKNPEIPD
eukprot:gene20342-26405_t